MLYRDLKELIERQEIKQGDKITILSENIPDSSKTPKVRLMSRIPVRFERVDTQYFVYMPIGEPNTKVYKVLNRIGGIEKIKDVKQNFYQD